MKIQIYEEAPNGAADGIYQGYEEPEYEADDDDQEYWLDFLHQYQDGQHAIDTPYGLARDYEHLGYQEYNPYLQEHQAYYPELPHHEIARHAYGHQMDRHLSEAHREREQYMAAGVD